MPQAITHVAMLLLAQAGTQPAVELAEPYVDASFRFSLRPPKNWALDAQRIIAPGESQLLLISDPNPAPFRPEIAVKWSAKASTATVADYVARFHKSLVDKASDLTILSDAPRRISGRPGAVFAAQYTLLRKPVIQMLAVVPTESGGYLTLTFTSPYINPPTAAQRVFDAVTDSIVLLDDRRTDAALRDAMARTATWIESLRGRLLTDRVQPPLWMRIMLNGREQGFVLIREEPFTLQKTDGVRVQESGWTFSEAGDAQRFENNLFVSNELDVEAWDSQTLTLHPAAADKPESISISHEEGLRDHDLLLTSQNYTLGRTPVNNPHLRLPAGYVSRLLLRWLPRLVDPSKPALYAATAYDHRRGGLVLRTLELAGPSAEGGFRVLDREGMGSQPVELRFDRAGRLRSMSAGELRMEAVADESATRRWAARVEEASRRIEDLSREFKKTDSRFADKPGDARP